MYLDKIINYIIEDCDIDYDTGEIHFPYLPKDIVMGISYFYKDRSPFEFQDYCMDNYGLTEDEIDYVWEQFFMIIGTDVLKRFELKSYKSKPYLIKRMETLRRELNK